MKKRFIMFAVGLSLVAIFAVSASARPFSFRIRADIPFDFNVGKKKMPKGEYVIESQNNVGVMTIRNAKKGRAVNFTAIQDKLTNKPKSRIGFRRYGDQYFLSRIWDGTGEIIYKIEKSSTEKKLAKALKKNENEDDEVDVNDKEDK